MSETRKETKEPRQELGFNIGADVVCPDGRCGKLVSVVLDPATEEVTGLIVEKGLILTEDRVVPVDLVTEATPEEIHVEVGADELNECRAFEEEAYTVPDPEWRSAWDGPSEVRFRTPPYGTLAKEPFVPKTRVHVREGVKTTEAVVGHGTPVFTVQGESGEVDHVLVDRESGELAHIVVKRGGLVPDYRIVPASSIEAVSSDGVSIDHELADLDDLPEYDPEA